MNTEMCLIQFKNQNYLLILWMHLLFQSLSISETSAIPWVPIKWLALIQTPLNHRLTSSYKKKQKNMANRHFTTNHMANSHLRKQSIWSWFSEVSLNLVSLFCCGEKPQAMLSLTPLQHHRGSPIKKTVWRPLWLRPNLQVVVADRKGATSFMLSNKRCMCFFFKWLSVSCILRSLPYASVVC